VSAAPPANARVPRRRISGRLVPRVRQLVVEINGNRNAIVAASSTTTTTERGAGVRSLARNYLLVHDVHESAATLTIEPVARKERKSKRCNCCNARARARPTTYISL